MAEAISYLTSIGFDITGVRTSLMQTEALLAESVKKINENPLYKINLQITKPNTTSVVQSLSSVDEALKKQSESAKTATASFAEQQKKAESASKATKSTVDTTSKSYQNLNASIKQTNESSISLLKTITDKARWLSAFYLIMNIRQAVSSTYTTIKETEMAVVDLQRVLTEDVGNIALQEGIYDLTAQYGRAFDEVSESAVKFAQAGNDWNETLLLTEATLLAVNTAELEVEQATTGLIAVLAQFGLEAEDMVSVIDQINITGDRFSVTSEKIVTALQRAGGAASSAGVELNETIAVITSLSEATGRSGENIGTALNSLISYTQKAGSLEVFASMNDQMNAVVRSYEAGATSITELWEQLSFEISKLTEDQVKALSELQEQDVSYQGFATQLESEATDITQSLREVYDTAGVYRRNYFIALLDNMDTYQSALETMTQAEGYSIEENEKYMSTLTAQTNALVAELKSLAVGLGEAGMLEFLKLLVQAGIATTEFIEQIGGLRTVLALVATAAIALKAPMIAAFGGGIVSNIKNVGVALNTLKTVISLTASGTTTLSQAMAFAGVSMSSLIAGGIGIAITALSFFNAKVQESIANTKERIRTLNDEVEAMKENQKAMVLQTNSINSLIDSYEQINSIDGDVSKGLVDNEASRENLLALQIQIAEMTGKELEEIQGTNDELDVQIAKLREIATLKELDQEYTLETTEAYQQMQEEVKKALDPQLFDFAAREMYGMDLAGKSMSATFDKMGLSFDEQIKYSGQLNKALTQTTTVAGRLQALTDLKQDLADNGLAASEFAKELDVVYENYKALAETADIASQNFKEMLVYDELIKFQDALGSAVDTPEEFEEFLQYLVKAEISLGDGTNASQTYKDGLLGVANAIKSDLIPQLTQADEALTGLNFNFTENQENVEALTEQVDSAQSSFDTISKAIEEYNDGQKFSIDTVQDLLALDQEYLQNLEFVNGQLQIVGGTTGELVTSKQALVKELIAEQTAAQIASLVTSVLAMSLDEVKGSSENAETALNNTETAINTIATQAVNGIPDLLAFGAALDTAYSGDYNAGEWEHYKNAILEGTEQIIKNSGEYAKAIGDVSEGYGKSSTDKEKTALEKLAEIYGDLISLEEQRLELDREWYGSNEDEIGHLKELQRLTHEYANELRALGGAEEDIKKLSTEWAKYQKEIIELEYGAPLELSEKKLELAELQNASSYEQVKMLKEQQDLLHQQAEAIRSYGGDLEDTIELSIEWANKQEEIKDILIETVEAEAELAKNAIEERIALAEKEHDSWMEQKEKEKEAVESRYETEIEQMQAVEAENDRIRAKQDYLDSLADAQRDLASAQARSGGDYREAEYEAEQEIAGIQEDWQEQLQDWKIEDTITKLETLKEKELQDIEDVMTARQDSYDAYIENLEAQLEQIDANLEKQIEAIEAGILTANDVLANATMQNNTMLYNDWKNTFVDPSITYYTDGMTTAQNTIVTNTGNMISQLKALWQKDFISPISQELSMLMSEASKGTFSNSLSGGTFNSSGGGNSQTTYNTNTSNARSMNMYVNVNADNKSGSVQRSIDEFYDVNKLPF